MVLGGHTPTPIGQVKRLSNELVCFWILDAWRSLLFNPIAKIFKKTGIKNALDGSKDKLLWDHDVETATSDLENRSGNSNAELSATRKLFRFANSGEIVES